MVLPDVNVLIYAHRREASGHDAYRNWLESVVNSDRSFGMAELALSGFIRIVTSQRAYREPTPLSRALDIANEILARPNCVPVRPGARHWQIFSRLCQGSGAKGNLVPDAYFAALAIEHGCEWITADRDFGRFQGLRWRHPLA
jgi:toxin-antitoxin system PIN domain toxin